MSKKKPKKSKADVVLEINKRQTFSLPDLELLVSGWARSIMPVGGNAVEVTIQFEDGQVWG